MPESNIPPEVICLGDINTDIIAPIARYPEPGGDGHADFLSIVPGGSAANTALALSRLSIRTGLIGRIGTDVFGTELLSRLSGCGLDVSRVQQDPQVATGLMFIPVTPNGERTMFGCRGANARLSLSQQDRPIITQARLLHLSGYSLLDSPQREAARKAMAWARAAGLQISLDVGLEAIKQQPALLGQWLKGLSLLLPNEAEATVLTGQPAPEQAVRWLLGRGVQLVALKRGREGCLIGRGDEMIRVPGFEVHSVDSTGAGDVFNAGFIAGRLRGLELRPAALLGNAMGALTTLHYGAQPPEVNELRTFLSNQRVSPAWAEWAGEFAQLDEFLFNLS